MTNRTITYRTYEEYLRSTDPTGYHVLHNNRLPDGTIEIVYTNDTRPAPRPNRQMTESEFIRFMAKNKRIDIM